MDDDDDDDDDVVDDDDDDDDDDDAYDDKTFNLPNKKKETHQPKYVFLSDQGLPTWIFFQFLKHVVISLVKKQQESFKTST